MILHPPCEANAFGTEESMKKTLPEETNGSDEKNARVLLDEKKLAALVGVRRRFLARWRQTLGARDQDYAFEGTRVALTVDGARKACRDIGAPMNTAMAIREACLEKNGEGISVRVKLCPQNEKIVLAVRLDTNDAVIVSVRSNLAMRVNDEFDAFDEGSGHLCQRGSWPERGW